MTVVEVGVGIVERSGGKLVSCEGGGGRAARASDVAMGEASDVCDGGEGVADGGGARWRTVAAGSAGGPLAAFCRAAAPQG